ncbi:MAG: TonB-dependent receptor [Sphingomicrobium sp.]
MNKSLWLATVGLAALTTTPAFAQTGGQLDPTTQNSPTAKSGAVAKNDTAQTPIDTGDIIVTATRRNEALSNVPLAVSAVTAESLRNTGATDLRQLNQVSPSLLVSSTSSEAGAGGARIRGIGTVGDNPGLESSVAVFIDGVYRSRIGVGLTELGALDRVEVLRGPQGTLFGRNASAGLISVFTAKPLFRTQVTGEATIGNYNLRRLEAGVTGPLSDAIAARIDGVYVKRDGFIRDVISGRDINNRDRYLIRGQLLFQPSSDLSVRLIGDFSKRNEECCAATYLPAQDAVANGPGSFVYAPSTFLPLERSLGAIITDDTYSRRTSVTPGRDYNSDVRDYGGSAELNYKFGAAQLTSITAYRYNKFIRGGDNDYNNLDILYRDGGGGAGNRFKTFTQELRLQGTTFGGHLDWLVGGYYADEKLQAKDNLSTGADYDRFFTAQVRTNPALASFPGFFALNAFAQGFVASQLATPAFAAIPVAARPIVINAIASRVANTPLSNVTSLDVFNQHGRNYALFTHNIIKITDALSATIGIRYTHDHKTLDANLASTDQCANYRNNITQLRALAASATANPATYGALTPAIVGLSNALAGTVLTPLTLAPCLNTLNSINGSFAGGDKKESRWTGTGVLSYKLMPSTLAYASYSRGYKGGGFNLDRAGLTFGNVNLNALQFEPELVTAYELGLKYKSRFIDVNVAGFIEDFKNFQLNTFNGINFVVENVNSCLTSLNGADTDPRAGTTVACSGKRRAGVRAKGIEIETFFRPIRNVRGALGATYVDTFYRDNLIGAAGNSIIDGLYQLPGRRLSNSAQFTGTGSLGWTPPIGSSGLTALIYGDIRHSSSLNTGSDLDLEKIQKAFNVVNARVGVRGPADSWAIELWAQNLFNTNYKQVAFDAPLQGLGGSTRSVQSGFTARSAALYNSFLGEPRTYGLTLRAKFSPTPRAAPDYVAPPAPPPPPPPPATQTCADGSVIAVDAACPVAPPPPPPPPPPPSKGERG